jgi:hypothetical protein
MVCDYATFRTIYRLSARTAVRRGVRSVIASISVIGSPETDEADSVLLSNRIGAAISNTLRRDDVVTGFDTTRHLILLGNLSVDDAEKVIRRLVEKIVGDVGDGIEVETDIKPLEAMLGTESTEIG